MKDKLQEFFESVKGLPAKLAEPEGADVDLEGQVIRFSEGVEAEVEVARSGAFRDMNGNEVKVTPDLMKGLASSLDLEKHEPKLKLGHEPIKTDTPDFGSVVGLSYDEAKDRLKAKIRPTLALVKRIRDGSFNRRSMEFSVGKDGASPRFLHLSFLGARKPAISGLAPVALAAEPLEEGAIAVAYSEPEEDAALAGPVDEARDKDGKWTSGGGGETVADRDKKQQASGKTAHLPIGSRVRFIDKTSPEDYGQEGTVIDQGEGRDIVKWDDGQIASIYITDPKSRAKIKALAGPADEAEPPAAVDPLDKSSRNENRSGTEAEEKNAMEATAQIERMKARLAASAKDRVDAFVTKNQKRIPNSAIKAGFEAGLVALMASEDAADEVQEVKFAAADGSEKSLSPSAFVMAMFAALPEQITPAEATETATSGVEEPTVDMAQFEGADEASVKYHLAVEAEIATAKEKGETLSYLEGVQRVERKNRGK